MNEQARTQLGGIGAILLGIAYIIVGFIYIALVPVEQKGGIPAELLVSFASNPTPLLIQDWTFIIGSLIGIAVVQSVVRVIGAPDNEWMRWSGILACLGFISTAIGGLRVVALLPTLAQQYVTGDAATKAAAVVSYPFLFPDPHGWLRFGAVGIWVLVVSLAILRRPSAPRLLGYAGLGVALLYWFLVLGVVISQPILTLIGAGAGGIILAPIWYIGIGVYLLRRNVTAPEILARSGLPRQPGGSLP